MTSVYVLLFGMAAQIEIVENSMNQQLNTWDI